MSNPSDLFPLGVEIDSTAPIVSSYGDINLRGEFQDLIYGRNGDTRIGQPLILRRMRRENRALVECLCVSPLTKEPDRDSTCPFCYGRGYLWDEELIYGYKVISSSPGGGNAEVNSPNTPYGRAYLPSARFFFLHDIALTKEDRIVEIDLDTEGNPILPYSRVFVYELSLIRAMRADNGKIEFWVANGQTMGPVTRGVVG